MLEIAFDSRNLRSLCESESIAQSELGIDVAALLKRRLADLRAATSISDVLAGKPRIIDANSGKNVKINLAQGRILVICANHPTNPLTSSDLVDWSRVSRVKILDIEGS